MFKQFVKNISTGVIVTITKLVVVFIMSPVIIKSLGNYDYGIWEMVFAIVGYMGILDFGLQPSIIRHVAKYKALNDEETLLKIYTSSLLFMITMGILVFAIIFLSSYALPYLFQDSKLEWGKYSAFLIIVALTMLIKFPSIVFYCVLEGWQRYDIKNYIVIVFLIVTNSIAYYMLINGGGLLTFAIIHAISSSIQSIIIGIITIMKKFGGFKFKLDNFDMSSLKELFVFGYKSFILGITSRIFYSTDTVIIGAYLSPSLIPFYIIPANLLNHLRSLLWTLSEPLMPLFSEIHAKRDFKGIIKIFINSSRYLYGIFLPALIGIAFIGPAFIERWIGAEYSQKGRFVLYILTLSYLIAWLNSLSSKLLTGIGKQGMLAKIRTVASIFNIAISIYLVQYYNIEGVALGTLFAHLIFEPFVLFYSCRELHINVSFYLNNVVRPLLLPNMLLIIFLWTITNNYEIVNYFNIVIIIGITAICYLLLFLIFSTDQNEKEILFKRLKTVFA